MTVVLAPAPAPAPQPGPARALARTGSLFGAFLIVGGAASGSGPGEGLAGDLPWIAAFAAAGLVLAAVAGALMDRALLVGGMRREIDRGNLAAGIASAAHRIALGIVTARCMYGVGLAALVVGAAFVAVGVVTLLVFQLLHRRLTTYADDQEVRGGNCAAALSTAGVSVALGVIVGHAAEGTFAGWGTSLRGYGLALLLALALYPVRQLLVQRMILGGGRSLDRAIASEHDHALGAVEGMAYLATALLVTSLI
jgi:uncharacterized membrane protein YjfL (UPF0719 family)